MKKKIKISLILSLAIIFGCFSNVFAASNQNNRIKKIAEVKKSVRLIRNVDTDDSGVIGTSNLNGTAENSAKLGDRLTSPEVGWKRYGISNSKIVSNTQKTSDTKSYGGSYYWLVNKNDYATFKFKGTKIRIITVDADSKATGGYPGGVGNISIDGNTDTFSTLSSLTYDVLSYQSPKLNDTVHTVTISNPNGGCCLWFEAIDIDSTGYLIDPSAISATGITLNKTTDSLILNDPIKGTDTLTAEVTPDNATNKTVKWTSSNSDIVSVDDNGNIKAGSTAGTATITATIEGTNLSKSCVVTVNEPTSITLDKTTDIINVGDIDKITASVTPAEQAVTWSSSDNSIVTVDGNGNIQGVSAGTVVITATTADGKTMSCTVTVKDKETGKSKLTLYMNDKTIREFYLTQDEIDDFIDWYTSKVKGEVTVQPYYVFNVSVPGKSSTKKSYVWFMKIESFEVE